MASASITIGTTFGALLLGGFCAATLSGVIIVQTFLYIKLFPNDPVRIKTTVAAVSILDIAHSVLIDASIWIFLITNYGNESNINTVPTFLALSGLIAGILTFIVHCFFSNRIHKLNRQRWQFTGLLVVLAFFRLCCAIVTTVELIHLKTFEKFTEHFRWVFTLGLAISSLVDILITLFMTHSLRTLKREIKTSATMDRVIGSAVLYTFETNILTSAVTIASMICWLLMPRNMIFLGLHFVIGKLYANSLFTMLNARKQLRYQKTSTSGGSSRSQGNSLSKGVIFSTCDETPAKLEITVARTVEFGVDDPLPSSHRLKHLSFNQPQRERSTHVPPCLAS